jgi:UMF1 family MFS transporter
MSIPSFNDPKITRAWCMYDWANSVFSLSIATSIFPIYFQNVTGGDTGMVHFGGFVIKNTVLYSFTLSFSYLLVSLLNPLLSGLSDIGGFRKKFMTLFTLLGSLSCMGLAAFTPDNLPIGVACFGLATMGYAGSLVFYNAYLPEIASPDQYDKLSARGFAMGYLGSVILLITNLLLISFYAKWGFASSGQATRFSFFTVGLWWLVFGLFSLKKLPKDIHSQAFSRKVFARGYKETLDVFKSIRTVPVLSQFLLAFFFFGMGTQTVMYVATLFGKDELNVPEQGLIVSIMLIQFVGIAGAYFFAFISKKIGNIRSIMLMIWVWIGVCIGAYFTYHAYQFYILAFVVGSVMGGIQSQSRSAFAALVPGKNDNASYFSFYELTEKLAIVLGTFSYGLLISLTGTMRNSILLLTVYFLLGLFLMFRLFLYKKRVLDM